MVTSYPLEEDRGQIVRENLHERKTMLSKFRAQVFSMTLVVDTSISLPRYAGSALRGAFGHAFRRVCCSMREGVCASCLLRETCTYTRLFEPSPPADSERLSRNQDIPAPFVIEPPDGGTYRSGDRIEFGLLRPVSRST